MPLPNRVAGDPTDGKPLVSMEDVFEAFGNALYYAQLMEYDIVSIWMVDSIAEGVSLTRRDLLGFQAEWGKKTFGQLLKPLQEASLIPEEIKEFCELLRVTRNRLVHGFFLKIATDLLSNTGRELAVAQLQQMTELLWMGKLFFGDVLSTYLKDFGVDTEAIDRQILQQSEDHAEQDGPGNGGQPFRSE
jgi:hypothetical protein